MAATIIVTVVTTTLAATVVVAAAAALARRLRRGWQVPSLAQGTQRGAAGRAWHPAAPGHRRGRLPATAGTPWPGSAAVGSSVTAGLPAAPTATAPAAEGNPTTTGNPATTGSPGAGSPGTPWGHPEARPGIPQPAPYRPSAVRRTWPA